MKDMPTASFHHYFYGTALHLPLKVAGQLLHVFTLPFWGTMQVETLKETIESLKAENEELHTQLGAAQIGFRDDDSAEGDEGESGIMVIVIILQKQVGLCTQHRKTIDDAWYHNSFHKKSVQESWGRSRSNNCGYTRLMCLIELTIITPVSASIQR